MATTVIQSGERGHWWNEWLDSKQSFPATGNFVLEDHAHGLLLIHNEDVVGPGEGFDTHQHRDTEIITWVLEGTVVHQDSVGNSGLIHPGLAQRMSAGTGILHSERNGAGYAERDKLHVVQMWIPPDAPGAVPSYQELDIAGELRRNVLIPVASGMTKYRGEAAIGIGNSNATFHVARLDAGASITVPDAPYGHVFVARGQVDFEGAGPLNQGDVVRLTADGGHRVTATEAAEVLVWEMTASV
ncbi:pirin family protein [Nocardia camponoti]|uniref:Pirin-like protein n=1 Tax=Nocardia camponoti TaxID=1616106 RepID=A0A917V5Z0_9NOCA|nr:pirin family protein [Nocardia camponoti]GGK41572.1 putative pirin-like protein [Nocardia camponoti]